MEELLEQDGQEARRLESGSHVLEEKPKLVKI